MGAPLLPGVGVLALPYHEWGVRWMTPHHVLPRLAEYFHVLWLEPAHHWREAALLGQRRDAGSEMAATLPAGFDRYVPEAWLPDVYRPAWLAGALLRARVARAWRRLRERGCRKLVLHLWHPKFECALDVGQHDVSLYHIDDEYAFTTDAPPIGVQEERVLRRVDQVFAISPRLMERKAGVNPNMRMVPEGVDFTLYSTPVPEPADLKDVPRPRIGYTGNLKQQLDWPLLLELVRSNPHLSFVFVGPRKMGEKSEAIVDELARLPNAYFLGAKTVVELAAYPQHFDVCTMPYTVDGYTDNIYPLKLHEYLASGQPIVGSPIRSLKDFRHVISLASTVEEWTQALDQALAVSGVDRTAAVERQQVARQHDWSELVFNIADSICERLGPDTRQELTRVLHSTGRRRSETETRKERV